MNIPVICLKCSNRQVIAKLDALTFCAACGCEDIDLDDFETTAAVEPAKADGYEVPSDSRVEGEVRFVAGRKTSVGEFDACPDCGVVGCSPDCPGPQESTTCQNCGGPAAMRNGKVECDHCSPQNQREAAQKLASKLHEIAAGVLTTNPSMTREAAYEVAEKTLTRYPKVAGIQVDEK